MPILSKDQHPYGEEMDRTYTPLEKRRRSEMSVRSVRLGFFKVPKGPTALTYCCECDKDITTQDHIVVNKKPTCWSCFGR